MTCRFLQIVAEEATVSTVGKTADIAKLVRTVWLRTELVPMVVTGGTPQRLATFTLVCRTVRSHV